MNKGRGFFHKKVILNALEKLDKFEFIKIILIKIDETTGKLGKMIEVWKDLVVIYLCRYLNSVSTFKKENLYIIEVVFWND